MFLAEEPDVVLEEAIRFIIAVCDAVKQLRVAASAEDGGRSASLSYYFPGIVDEERHTWEEPENTLKPPSYNRDWQKEVFAQYNILEEVCLMQAQKKDMEWAGNVQNMRFDHGIWNSDVFELCNLQKPRRLQQVNKPGGAASTANSR